MRFGGGHWFDGASQSVGQFGPACAFNELGRALPTRREWHNAIMIPLDDEHRDIMYYGIN